MYFSTITDFVDIAGRSSATGLANISKPVGENGEFQALRENVSQTVSNTATVTINHQQEVAYRLRNVDW